MLSGCPQNETGSRSLSSPPQKSCPTRRRLFGYRFFNAQVTQRLDILGLTAGDPAVEAAPLACFPPCNDAAAIVGQREDLHPLGLQVTRAQVAQMLVGRLPIKKKAQSPHSPKPATMLRLGDFTVGDQTPSVFLSCNDATAHHRR
jgi:hypothetical protein